jgi:Na+-translocating ferredoxin:NAD+ oxidoreductase RnfG subunit
MKKQILFPIITFVASVCILLALNLGLAKVAEDNASATELRVMQTLLPDSSSFVEEIYTGEDANIVSVHKGETGYVIETLVYGYADDIRMMIALTLEGEVRGIMVLEMHETFGLGLNALRDHKFLSQFFGSSEQMQVGDTIDAITGATVTSKAITKSVNSAIAYITGADIDSGATEWGA